MGENKEEKKEIQTIEGNIKIKPKNKFTKFMEQFIEEDLKSVLSWAAKDVLVPALKKMFVEFIDNTANSMVYGRSNRPTRSATSNISYREYYDRPRNDYRESWTFQADDIYSVGSIEVESRAKALEILDRMDDYIACYRVMTVGAFMQMLKKQPKSTDFNYGWSSTKSAKIHPGRHGGYVIELPRVIPIDR